MPKLVPSTAVKTIHAEWWAKHPETGLPLEVAVIRRLSFGQRETLMDRSMVLAPMREGSEPEVVYNLKASRQAMLELGVQSMTDAEGQPVAVTPENLQALEDKDAEFILAEIEALNPKS